jgi:hypothetical protein
LPGGVDIEHDQPTTPAFTQQEYAPTQPSSPLPIQKPSSSKRVSPSHDFYNDCYRFSPLIYTFLITAIMLGLWNTVLQRPLTDTYQPICLVYFYFAVLIATDLCRHTPASRTVRLMVWTCCFLLYSGVLAYNTFMVDFAYVLAVYSSTCVAITIFAEWKLWRASHVSKEIHEEQSL